MRTRNYHVPLLLGPYGYSTYGDRDGAGRTGDRPLPPARALTDEPGFTTRTFLSPATREAHALVRSGCEQAGMTVRIDAAGNVRGTREARYPGAPRVILGSHLDTVPRAGAFDGIFGSGDGH